MWSPPLPSCKNPTPLTTAFLSTLSSAFNTFEWHQRIRKLHHLSLSSSALLGFNSQCVTDFIWAGSCSGLSASLQFVSLCICPCLVLLSPSLCHTVALSLGPHFSLMCHLPFVSLSVFQFHSPLSTRCVNPLLSTPSNNSPHPALLFCHYGYLF